MNRQQVFDRVYTYFITDKNPRSIGKGAVDCLYRGPDGAKCAAGLFILDEDYNVCMEGNTVDSMDYKILERGGVDMSTDGYLLSDLQSAHDDDTIFEEGTYERIKNPLNFEERLRKVAETYKLEVPVG